MRLRYVLFMVTTGCNVSLSDDDGAGGGGTDAGSAGSPVPCDPVELTCADTERDYCLVLSFDDGSLQTSCEDKEGCQGCDCLDELSSDKASLCAVGNTQCQYIANVARFICSTH